MSATEPLERLLERLRREGRTHYVVSGATKAELLDSFAAELGFPDYFGRNLDALADCLRDVRLRTPATIVWVGAQDFHEHDCPAFHAIETILASYLPDDVEVVECPR